jgi:hypothetical protein
MVAPVVAAIMLRWIFNDQFGIVNVVLDQIGIEGPSWFTQRWSAFAIILLTDVRLWTPWFTLLLRRPAKPAEGTVRGRRHRRHQPLARVPLLDGRCCAR